MNLLSLPTAVLCDIIGCRLSLEELVRLDGAFCCQYRNLWIQLLRSKQFTFHALVQMANGEFVQWAMSRNVKVSNIEFVNDSDLSVISKYLRIQGSSVRSVHFVGRDIRHELSLVTIHCRSLTTLRFTEVALTWEFTNLLHYNPTIQRLECENVVLNEPNLMKGLSLHKLQSLRMVGVEAGKKKGCLWNESIHSDSLHTVIWDDCAFEMENLTTLLTNCVQLRSFSCNDNPAGGPFFLEHYAYLMTRLINLSASGDDSLTDDAVLTLAKNLTSLYTLSIRDCSGLTDRALLHLAEHSSSTLEVLCANIHNPESRATDHILETFAQKCTKLRYLNINCGYKVLCAGRGASLLVRGCPALQTLVVNRHEVIGRSSRDFIATFRPELKLLVHDNSTVYDILSMPM